MRDRCRFTLEVVEPYRLELCAWALRRRPSNEIDRWQEDRYRRVLVLPAATVEAAVAQLEPGRLEVELAGDGLSPDLEPQARAALERLLGCRVDLDDFYALAARDEDLGPLVERLRGLKPARYPSVFEALVNAIACQQVSLHAGIRMLSRLTLAFGAAVEGLGHAFPRAEDLVRATPGELRELGFSFRKADYVLSLARSVAERGLDLEALALLPSEEAASRLDALPGVGRWSAEYVLLRGLGRLDVFPGDDVGAQGKLRRWLGVSGPLRYDDVIALTARWQPYAGLVYFHLLVDSLDLGEAGAL